MEFVSILGKVKVPFKDMTQPVFMEDLNLDQVVAGIQSSWPEPIRPFYYYLPEDKECEDYRRAIYQEIKQPEVFQLFNTFAEQMRKYRASLSRKKMVSLPLQKAIWMLIEVGTYCEAFFELKEGLQKLGLQAEGLKDFMSYLTNYTSQDSVIKMKEQSLKLLEELQRFRLKLVYEKERIVVTEEVVSGTYETSLKEQLTENVAPLQSPFSKSLNLTVMEQEIVNIVQKKNSSFFKQLAAFCDTYHGYEESKLLQFCEEIAFYLSFYSFEQKRMAEGFAFVTPTVDADRTMYAESLYDLALALVNYKEKKPVISNDCEYRNGEQFFVLTGPNQGGKTTFARSLGQLVYFTKLGLDVPAVSANVHHFTDILTHFSVEESVETGRGKLKEELIRLKPMMQEQSENAFVIINELFTTAANYDACIMGEKVLLHFIKNQSRGIYVTHIKELSETHPAIVSLRAMLDETHQQNFRIIRKEADDSACALNQVNKYALTYAQLKERLTQG